MFRRWVVFVIIHNMLIYVLFPGFLRVLRGKKFFYITVFLACSGAMSAARMACAALWMRGKCSAA